MPRKHKPARKQHKHQQQHYRYRPGGNQDLLDDVAVIARDDKDSNDDKEEEEEEADEVAVLTVPAAEPAVQVAPLLRHEEEEEQEDTDGWSLVGEEEEDSDDCSSQWTLADGQGSFLNAAVRALDTDADQPRALVTAAASVATVKDSTQCAVSLPHALPPHFDGEDEHWAHKNRGAQKVTARVLHGGRRG